MAFEQIQALVFDVFGTVVDYRSSIIREGLQLNQAKNWQVDWGKFSDSWRGKYQPYMNKVRTGELEWTNLDSLHRMSLEEVLQEFGVSGLSETEKDDLSRVWHRLSPWPDAVEGLTRLKSRYVIATLSNGNVALLTNMAKFGKLPWDCILSAELFKAYKPDAQAYLGAAQLLGLRPAQVMLVAAHQDDLRAAQKQGLKAAFVPRPLEFGPDKKFDLTPDKSFDIVASDFLDLADQLGV